MKCKICYLLLFFIRFLCVFFIFSSERMLFHQIFRIEEKYDGQWSLELKFSKVSSSFLEFVLLLTDVWDKVALPRLLQNIHNRPLFWRTLPSTTRFSHPH